MIIDDSIEKAKSEVSHGIGSVIHKIFDAIFQPILDLISKVFEKIKEKHNEKKALQREAENTHNFVLTHYAYMNRFGIVAHYFHNGKKSDTGKSFKYICCFFNNIFNERNELMQRFTEKSLPEHIYTAWINHCYNNINVHPANFDKRMKAMFTAETRWICFRHLKDCIYLICSEDADIPTESQEQDIIELLDDIITARKKRKRIK